MPGLTELVEVLVGIRRQTAGEIMFCGKNLSRLSVRKRWEKGVAYVPSDRHQDGLIMDADITSNFALRIYYRPPYSKRHILQLQQLQRNAQEQVDA